MKHSPEENNNAHSRYNTQLNRILICCGLALATQFAIVNGVHYKIATDWTKEGVDRQTAERFVENVYGYGNYYAGKLGRKIAYIQCSK